VNSTAIRRTAFRSVLVPVAVVAIVASTGSAQIATSPNAHLESFGFGNTGGGACSIDVVAFTQVGEPTGGMSVSPNFSADIGFLGAFEPDPPAGLVVFGVAPKFGPMAGGTTVTVSGFNFDKFGAGPTTQVFVGGTPAMQVTVTSNTSLSFTTPPGTFGPAEIAIANSAGSVTVPNGFLYAPALATSQSVPVGGIFELANYGAPGDNYLTLLSTTRTSINAPPYGTLLIGPAPLIQLLPILPYGPTGESSFALPVPEIPMLSGLTLHFQSVSLFATGGPPPGKLTNATSTTIL
jgi:IPT/TIG domain